MTNQHLSSTAEGGGASASLPGADDYTFRSDDPVMLEMDVFQLDCIVDRLKGADLADYRASLSRIASNLNDLMENPNGHAH